MANLNQVFLAGNLTRDAELRVTASGMQVLSLTVAVNENYQNKQTGEWDRRAHFIDCKMFGKEAEKASGLGKGDEVMLWGKLSYSQWQTKDGATRSKLEVVANGLKQVQRKEAKRPEEDLYPYDVPF